MSLQLKDLSLVKRQGFIDGEWVDADSGAVFAVTDPATGQTLIEVADMGVAETQRAIDAAARALPAWRARTAKDRGAILRRWFDLIIAHTEDLAQLMTAEQGKPLAEARGEVAYGASFIEWFAEEGKRAYGDIIPTSGTDRRLMVLKQPIGVCAAITPWNFPIAMITRKVAPALAAGCTVVAKPAEATPLSALALVELAVQAGLPAGVLNLIVADAPNAPAIGLGMNVAYTPREWAISFTSNRNVMMLSAIDSASV